VLDEAPSETTSENSPKESRWRAREAREEERFIAPHGLDEPGPGAIRARRDVAGERRRFKRRAAVRERTDDEQPLPRLQVEADLTVNSP